MKKRALLLLIATFMVAQDKPKTPITYTPTHEQKLEIENAQLRAQIAQAQLQKANDNFKTQVQLLQATCKAVATENKWPTTVECDMDTLTFTDKAVKPEVKK